VKQGKIKPVTLSIVKLRLAEGINSLQKIKNLLEGFGVTLKVFLD